MYERAQQAQFHPTTSKNVNWQCKHSAPALLSCFAAWCLPAVNTLQNGAHAPRSPKRSQRVVNKRHLASSCTNSPGCHAGSWAGHDRRSPGPPRESRRPRQALNVCAGASKPNMSIQTPYVSLCHPERPHSILVHKTQLCGPARATKLSEATRVPCKAVSIPQTSSDGAQHTTDALEVANRRMFAGPQPAVWQGGGADTACFQKGETKPNAVCSCIACV